MKREKEWPECITCPECDGTGWIAPAPELEPHPGYDCPKCEGSLEIDARLEDGAK